MDPTPQAQWGQWLPRAFAQTQQLSFGDRFSHYEGAHRSPEGPSVLGCPQAARPDARACPSRHLPSASTVCRILLREGLARSRRRFRRAHPGCPKTSPQGPNDIWAADYKGQFRLKNGQYCFPLTVSDLASRFLLGVDAHPAVSLDLSRKYFTRLFEEFGLPNRIRTDNGVPFASNALARLSALSVWFIKLGIYPELIEPGRPQQNAVHERMHRTLKRDATIPPASSFSAQQRKFDAFRQEFNELRPHESLGMQRPAQLYRPSTRAMPRRLAPYDYPSHLLKRRVSRDGTIRVLASRSSSATPCMMTSWVWRRSTTGYTTCTSASTRSAATTCSRTRSRILSQG